MGGKKKTKWRKLPIEEFTKECTDVQQQKKSEENKAEKRSFVKDESSFPNFEDQEANQMPLGPECHENFENVWYPTHYVVYNPLDVPLYSNYVMPSDANCYYYPANEVGSSNEYAPPAVYQEYFSAAKDTIYLLFPASSIRPQQCPPYDWRGRRRRRRYGGYAEYAVIPDKRNAESKTEDNQTATDKLDCTSNQFVKSNYQNNKHEILQNSSCEPDIVKVHKKAEDKCETKSKMGLSNDEKNNTSTKHSKKSENVCGIHTKYSERQEPNFDLKSPEETTPMNKLDSADNKTATSTSQTNKTITLSENLNDCDPNERNVLSNDRMNNLANESGRNAKNNEEQNSFELKTNNDILQNQLNENFSTNTVLEDSSNYNEQENETKSALVSSEIASNVGNEPYNTNSNDREDADSYKHSQKPMPDILNTIKDSCMLQSSQASHKSIIPNNITSQSLPPVHNSRQINELRSTSTSILPQSNLPYSSNTDAVNYDNEAVLKSNRSLQATSSIYKLAYDENITDQSDSGSRSPSPISPESQMPSSLMSNEINVYEADSDDEAGSEDLELIPHRYESYSSLNKSKHLYENKLSLAVELLRTKESLPYDDQFKRVSFDEDSEPRKSEATSKGEVNLGFQDDSIFSDSIEMKSQITPNESNSQVITKQCKSPHPNAAPFEISLEPSLTESCEIADEANFENIQENTEDVKAGYRRFGIQFQHYFSPRSSIVNPLNCCILM